MHGNFPTGNFDPGEDEGSPSDAVAVAVECLVGIGISGGGGIGGVPEA